MFRERELELEANVGQNIRISKPYEPPKVKRRLSSELIPGPAIGEASVDDIKDFDALTPGMDPHSVDDIKDFDALTPGMDPQPVSEFPTTENNEEYATPYPKLEGVISDSDGIFQEPRDTIRKQGEKSLTSNCGSCLSELPDFKSTDIPRVEYLSQKKIKNIANDQLLVNVSKSSGTLKSHEHPKNVSR